LGTIFSQKAKFTVPSGHSSLAAPASGRTSGAPVAFFAAFAPDLGPGVDFDSVSAEMFSGKYQNLL
jgi:hypothetical protein